MTSSKRKYAFWPSRRTLKGCVSEFIHPGTWFQKTPFSCDAFTGFVWTIGQNDAKHLRFNQKTAPCGRALNAPHCDIHMVMSFNAISIRQYGGWGSNDKRHPLLYRLHSET